MDGIAILDSGNYVMKLCNSLERKGYVFEVTSTPCHITKNGCSYCLRFPIDFMNVVLAEADINNLVVREIYKIEPQITRNKYIKIY